MKLKIEFAHKKYEIIDLSGVLTNGSYGIIDISFSRFFEFGNFVIKFDTMRKLAYVPFMFLSDPYALHKWLYYMTGAWMWQFGGTSSNPGRTRRAPFRLKWEVYDLKNPRPV